MIIQFGPDKDSPYGSWADHPGIFISKPYFKIVLDNGLGFYILNTYKFYLFPKFYSTFNRSFWELGFKIANWNFEIMWNKVFKNDC